MNPDQILEHVEIQDCRAIFISDIHGEVTWLDKLLHKVNYQPEQDKLFLLGDLIEKGSENLKTLRRVMELSQNPNVIVLQGNNDKAEQLLEDKIPVTMKLGYLETRNSLITEMAAEQRILLNESTDFDQLGKKLREVYAEEFEFLKKLPLVVCGHGYAAAHSSLNNVVDLDDNRPEKILKDNDFLLTSDKAFPIPVIVGHMPTVALSPEQGNCGVCFLKERNLFAIDGGCGMHKHGQLNALIVENGDFEHYTSVSADFLPVKKVIRAQAGTPKEKQVFVRYFESRIDVLSEADDFLSVRHHASGKNLEIPRGALRYIHGETHCFNSTSCRLEVNPDDRVSVIQEYADRSFCKKSGLLGWVEVDCLEK